MQTEKNNLEKSENLNSEIVETVNTETTKKEKKKKTAKVKKQDEKNIDSLLERLEKTIQKNHTSTSSKKSMYKNANYENLTRKEKESFRRKLRSKLEKNQSILKIAFVNFKQNKLSKSELLKSFETFKKFYFEEYNLNDFSVNSIYSGSTESVEFKNHSDFIEMCNEILKIKK